MSKRQSVLRGAGWALVILVAITSAGTAYGQETLEPDFLSSRYRVAPGDTVTFFDVSGDDSFLAWQWYFGDGSRTDVLYSGDPVYHEYSSLGSYDVSLEVASNEGTGAKEKLGYIEVMNAPFADFIYGDLDAANIIFGTDAPGDLGEVPEGTIFFVDRSVGDATTGDPVDWQWSFGDGQTASGRSTRHLYVGANGVFRIRLVVTYANGSMQEIYRSILVGAGAAGGDDEEHQAARFEVTDLTADGECLMPLNDWVPLFAFTMESEPPDKSAKNITSDSDVEDGKTNYSYYTNIGFKRRTIGWADGDRFRFTVCGRNDDGDNIAIDEEDLLEFALIRYRGDLADWAGDGQVVLRWTPDGTQVQLNTGVPFDPREGPMYPDPDPYEGFSADKVDGMLVYELWGQMSDPDPITGLIQAQQFITTWDAPTHWVLIARTSATWTSGNTLSFALNRGLMVDYMGIEPRTDDGTLIDTYVPEKFDNKSTCYHADCSPYTPETRYASEFMAFDCTSGLYDDYEIEFPNAWNWPNRMYTPTAEYTRPRWDAPDAVSSAFDFVTGEWLDLRKLFSIDAWRQMVGLTIHATNPPQVDAVTDNYAHGGGSENGELVSIKELNLIVVDLHGDPTDPDESGLDPVEEFERMTYDCQQPLVRSDYASANDFAFNGIWVYADSNNNGIFDPPTPDPSGVGVNFVDRPMLPWNMILASVAKSGMTAVSPDAEKDTVNEYLPQWKKIDNPPGGGPPWHKIRLELSGGSREGPNMGFVEPAIDSIDDIPIMDYFVVVRPDGGYKDVSDRAGDNVGMTPGAAFKVFVEPRRFNAGLIDPYTGPYIDPYVGPNGSWDGGLYVDCCLVPQGVREDAVPDDYALQIWQNNPLWMEHEPWWPQRTMNKHSAKPVQATVQVDDLVMTYGSNSTYALTSDIEYPLDFTTWMDPLGDMLSKFYWQGDGDVWVGNWVVVNGTISDEDSRDWFQHAFETAPFFNKYWDEQLNGGPRSSVFPYPPAQPEMPEYATWPYVAGPGAGALETGQYPRLSDWPLENRKARILKQHIDSESPATAMIGINLAGVNDPVATQYSRPCLQQITVAFWGPDFHPDDLLELDPDGTDPDSGVLLLEDTNKDSVHTAMLLSDGNGTGLEASDSPVPLRYLRWRSTPEPVDIDGDGNADDMNGDGAVDERDYAWVLRLRPQTAWPLPDTDEYEAVESDDDEEEEEEESKSATTLTAEGVPAGSQEVEGESYWAKKPVRVTRASMDAMEKERAAAQSAAKNIGPTGNSGDDLFIVVKTSRELSRLEEFKAFIPAAVLDPYELGGIQITPGNTVAIPALQKLHPEEESVQPWYGHEMLQANVPVEVLDFTGAGQTIYRDGDAVAVLGIDAATNRPDLTVASGTGGISGEASFTVTGASWTAGEFVGYYLIDSRFESFEIVSNSDDRLGLLSGTPANDDGAGEAWRIVKNPTFLEQLIVELYDEDEDGSFNMSDLLDLDIDPTVSGIALYRDNDSHPANRNGEFDPDVDIPVALDWEPYLTGAVGEPDIQVMFVFSSPGTDDIPLPREQQARNRQWIPETFGDDEVDDPNTGADFFVVVRASTEMQDGDDFRAAIVSWGPSTPTEPDPDTFPPPPTVNRGEFDVFSEFPWGARALGFVTVYQENDYPDSGMPTTGIPDNSGFNFIRTTASRAVRTNIITASEPVGGVTIDKVSPSTVLLNTPASGQTLTISGSGFGDAPTATLGGYSLVVTAFSDTLLTAIIPGGSVLDAAPLTLTVRNTDTKRQASVSDLIEAIDSDESFPVVTLVDPDYGTRDDFPVTVYGSNFDSPKVYFGETLMPVAAWTPTSIEVNFPGGGGLPKTGLLDVKVVNKDTDLEDRIPDAFEYVSAPVTPTPCFIATAAYGSPLEPRLAVFRDFRDTVLLKTAGGTAFVDMYYTVSPPVAKAVAQRPWLAAVVRLALTPVAWVIDNPWATGMAALSALALMLGRRRHAARKA